MQVTRRALLGGSAAAGLVLGTGASAGSATDLALRSPAALAAPLPAPGGSGIEHVVVVMMENRSFDHMLGWLPGADGRQAGIVYTDRYGHRQATHHLTRFDSCGFADPDHSYEGGRIELNRGRCDGWLKAGQNDLQSIGYYLEPDLPFLGPAARSWTTFDRYFAPVMAETYPNRFYLHAAQTDRLHNNTDQATMPTIWDRLAAAGVSHSYYFSDIPFTALWYSKYLGISQPYADFLTAAATGSLPAVSFVDPRFEDEDSGTSNDDHPHADIRAGEAFLNQVYDAVRNGPGWANTVLVVTFDEWGGFFDHVRPAKAPDVSRLTSLRGFRVPTLLISPFARRGYVSHEVFDHTSILKMIEWRWGLPSLTPRDAAANNLADALAFDQPPNLPTPTFTVPPFTSPGCSAPPGAAASGAEYAEWPALRDLAVRLGWSLPS